MTHHVRLERRDGRPWWTCAHCHDSWTHPPTDICKILLDQLEAEHVAGWNTVTPALGAYGRPGELLDYFHRTPQRHLRSVPTPVDKAV